MKNTKLILVGGFLGAGKTTMMGKAAEILKGRGKTVGLVTNDQATDLVDTNLLAGYGNDVRELPGSCFCCNFPGFIAQVDDLTEATNCDITLAEPVGSCTDLSATIVQPVKDKYADTIDLAPLTVMADPERIRGILDDEDSTPAYIMGKQFDEADVILINKIDLLSDAEAEDLKKRAEEKWPKAKVFAASVKEGTGVEDWLDFVLDSKEVGENLADVDYDTYAAGEAAYGWLNLTYTLGGDGDYAAASQKLLDTLAAKLEGIGVGHVKFLVQDGTHQWMGNITGGAEEPLLRDEDQEADTKLVTVNARVEVGPLELEKIVVSTVDEIFADLDVTDIKTRVLIPGRPNPTYHYDHVVE